jgi:hypothetical protein
MAPERLALLLALALPGLAGAAVMVALWGALDLLKLAAALATAPYLLGAYELYKAACVRATQGAIMTLLPAALELADRIIPKLLEEGMRGDALEAAVRERLIEATKPEWTPWERKALANAVTEEACKMFDPRVLLDKAAQGRKE